nr:STE20-like serine/threonine-protein kinase isoform X2 [Biomphalaria glabrata]
MQRPASLAGSHCICCIFIGNIKKMWPYLELADVMLKLRNLEEIKECVHNIVERIDSIKKKGELWIEEKETSTFIDIKHYITEKTLEVVQSLISITSSTIQKFVDSPSEQADTDAFNVLNSSSIDLESEKFQETFRELDSCVTLQRNILKRIHQQLQDPQTLKQKVDDDSASNLKVMETFEGKLNEFKVQSKHKVKAANTFRSHLQSQYESLLKEISDSQVMDKEQDTKIELMAVKTGFLVKNQEDINKYIEAILHEQGDFSYHMENALHKRVSWELLCKETGNLSVKCFKDCPHIIGHHEQQISEGGEADLYIHLESCKKNPGHTKFVPIDTFTLEHLPEIHRYIDLYALIRSAADLTVRVSVTMTSPDRPEFWPNTNIPYFLYHVRESESLRTGSGRVSRVVKGKEEMCQCTQCKLSASPNKDWWTITVWTAASLVFDETEANHTSLRFFYDKTDNPEITVTVVVRELLKDVSVDYCVFDCVTCDKTLVDKLEPLVQKCDDLYLKVNEKYKKTKDIHQLMFIVSHPHGCTKRLSIGRWQKKYLMGNRSKKYTYFTCTCPGSSGASVYCLGCDWRIHSGSLDSGLNYSSA